MEEDDVTGWQDVKGFKRRFAEIKEK